VSGGSAGLPRRRALAVAGGAVFLAASVGLFFLSRGKWSDAIIDSGREWIVPDALARGELLYRDVVYWFGPFTPYFHAGFFRLFGSSFSTLVAAGVVGSLGVLAALFFALRTVTGKLGAAVWTALAVPALVFMPGAGGSILGMGYRIWHAAAFSLLAVALASRLAPARRPLLRGAGIGALCALAGLCRTEWGLVAALAAFAARARRDGFGRSLLRDALVAASAFLLLFGGTIAAFAAAAGPKAVFTDGHLLLSGLPGETRAFLIEFSGVRGWPNGVLELLYSTAMWAGALLSLEILAIARSERAKVMRRLRLLAAVLLFLGLCALLGGAEAAVFFSAAPLVCAAAAVFAAVRSAPESPALLGFGLAGLLLSYRRPFHIGDAPYVGPPLLFAFVSAAALLQILMDREASPSIRERFRALTAGAVLLLAAAAFLGRAAQYRSDDRVPIPGTDSMLSARPELVAKLSGLARTIRRESGRGDGLVVFPEGEVLNYLTGRANPIRHKLYIPSYVNDDNEAEVLAELQSSFPGVIVVLHRFISEYGRGFFGVGYGKKIRRWIEENYDVQPIQTVRPFLGRFRAWEVLALRRRPAG